MAVMDADRFGVSQLHQLRGRVGRGSAPGLCLLVTESVNEKARERLTAVAKTTDGFELAELDLEQRREGDVLGQAQSGRRSQLRLLSLLRDREIIQEARTAATDLVAADPDLSPRPPPSPKPSPASSLTKANYLEKPNHRPHPG
jgi:ATP-dependent DNA helicase RecG